MPWTAIAGSAISGIAGALGSRSAARRQRRAIEAATQEQRLAHDEAMELLQPRMQTEGDALNRLAEALGLSGQFDPSVITDDPGFAFALGQGQQAVERSAAARGGLASGNTLAALTDFGQGLGAQRHQEHVNNLMRLIGMGTDVHAAGMRTDLGRTIGDLMLGRGEVDARRDMGTAGAIAGVATGVSGALGRHQILNRLAATQQP